MGRAVSRRRRHYRVPRPGRIITFGPCLVLPAWGYAATGHVVHWEVAAALFLGALLIWPALVVWVLFLVPAVPSLLVPRRWRIAHRRRHGRENCRSARIPEFLRSLVYAADRYSCVYCGRMARLPGDLNVDHFRPWSQGGLTTLGNLITLCAHHNRVKSNYWPGVFYRPLPGADNRALAADILHRERMARLSLLRWARIAWALG